MGGIISKKADPADAETSEGWKSYLTTEEQEAVLREAHLIQQGHAVECHRQRKGGALFRVPNSGWALRCKLAELLAALENGADPNEREKQDFLQHCSGGPLDLCLDDSKSDMGEKSLLNNIPVIQLLMDYGADPRLDPIPQWKGRTLVPLKPVEQVQWLIKNTENGPMKRFYEEAYLVLKKGADRLDRLDKLGGTPGSEKGEQQT